MAGWDVAWGSACPPAVGAAVTTSPDVGDNGLWFPDWSPEGPLFTKQMVAVMRYLWTAQWDSTEELSENLGQGFLTRVCEAQDVYTITVCVSARAFFLVAVHHFHHILK